MVLKSDPRNIRHLLNKLKKKGDRDAFDSLFFAFEPQIHVFALKLTHNPEDAREIVQEVFLKVWEKRKSIDPKQHFGGYLYTIAKNLVYNRARHRVYEFAYKKYMTIYAREADYSTEHEIRFNELTELIQTYYDELPPVRQKVFAMSRFEGMSNKEVAMKLGTSTSNVKNHLNKALTVLRHRAKKYEIGL